MTTSKNTKLIPLTQGKFAIVDAEDYEWLMQWKWYFHTSGYAHAQQYIGCFDGKSCSKGRLMHRLIANTPKGMVTDHINGNKLDNRRCNLRVCTQSENLFNQKSIRAGTSQYKGVHWNTKRCIWISKIMVKKKIKHIGQFDSELEAAIAYNLAARKYHGEFARVNVIL